ncbi:MAG: universal stress protein [Burkholderiales bacterium]
MFKHMLLPTDGSPLSEVALRKGMELAKSSNARVTRLFVVPEFHVLTYRAEMLEETRDQYAGDTRAQAKKNLAVVEELASAYKVPCDTVFVINDHPYEAIIKAAEDRGCDLIAMASHGRSGVKGVLLGSQTQKVLTHTSIPVIVFRAPKR